MKTCVLNAKSTFFACLLISFIYTGSVLKAQDLTVTIDPGISHQEVTFGGDGKLKIKVWAEGNVSSSCQKLFNDMKLQTLRIPIFVLQDINDPIYDNVITVCNEAKAKNPNLKIFASVANGDGYGTDYHGAEKFPASMRGCCSYNVYSLNLSAYAAYLDSFMDRMSNAGVTVDYLGPFNEDPADDSDYRKTFNQMTKLGNTKKVGLERWGLLSSINDVNDVEDRVDIIGSHIYDDANIANPENSWSSLVTQSSKPVWYTEATRYSTTDGIDQLVAGMENIIDPMNAGVEHIIFYQVVKRFVYANGSPLTKKYTGFKNMVNSSFGKSVVESNSSDDNIDVVVFGKDNNLSIHLINKTAVEKKAKMKLVNGYLANGNADRTIWTSTDTEVTNSYNLSNRTSWTVTLPANSYVNATAILNNNVKSVETFEIEPLSANLKVYPNPSSGLLNINVTEFDPQGLNEITIRSLDGKMIYRSEGETSMQHDFSNFE
ncbi:MAG: hypothetical protein MI922_02225, partial [Bacteroidales bacterium]|nr:hypothetical protein [Bacteroidales bacterium]